MRTTVDIEDDLLEQARWLSGLDETSALVRAGLEALIVKERTRRLALLGGSQSCLEPVPRRRL